MPKSQGYNAIENNGIVEQLTVLSSLILPRISMNLIEKELSSVI